MERAATESQRANAAQQENDALVALLGDPWLLLCTIGFRAVVDCLDGALVFLEGWAIDGLS